MPVFTYHKVKSPKDINKLWQSHPNISAQLVMCCNVYAIHVKRCVLLLHYKQFHIQKRNIFNKAGHKLYCRQSMILFILWTSI